jgi:hypothetical protein
LLSEGLEHFVQRKENPSGPILYFITNSRGCYELLRMVNSGNDEKTIPK